jgi:hypothetical protein
MGPSSSIDRYLCIFAIRDTHSASCSGACVRSGLGEGWRGEAVLGTGWQFSTIRQLKFIYSFLLDNTVSLAL